MTIDRIEIFAPTHRLARERVYSTGGGFVRGSILVRIADHDGVQGWGETYPHSGVVATIAELARALIGFDPLRASEIQQLLRRRTRDGFAISALSIAIDDLRAQRAGVPIATLYGGAIRSSARAYASSGGYVAGLAPIDTWREEAARVAAAGITGFKLRIGREPPGVEIPMLEQLADEQNAIGSAGLDLMADGNAAYTPAQALDVGRALAGAGYRWFEEPIPTDDYAGYAFLRARLPVPLAGGESVQSRGAARRLIEQAVDIIQPDPTICGGIGDALSIAELARQNAIQMHPHACNGAIALAATLQLIAVLPRATRMGGQRPLDEPLLEYDFGENPLRTELLATPLELRDGRFTIPNGPGLGVDVDEGRLVGSLVHTER